MEWMITRTGFHAEFFALIRLVLAGDARDTFPQGKARKRIATPVCSLVRNDNFCFDALLLAAYSSLYGNTNTGLPQMG